MDALLRHGLQDDKDMDRPDRIELWSCNTGALQAWGERLFPEQGGWTWEVSYATPVIRPLPEIRERPLTSESLVYVVEWAIYDICGSTDENARVLVIMPSLSECRRLEGLVESSCTLGTSSNRVWLTEDPGVYLIPGGSLDELLLTTTIDALSLFDYVIDSGIVYRQLPDAPEDWQSMPISKDTAVLRSMLADTAVIRMYDSETHVTPGPFSIFPGCRLHLLQARLGQRVHALPSPAEPWDHLVWSKDLCRIILATECSYPIAYLIHTCGAAGVVLGAIVSASPQRWVRKALQQPLSPMVRDKVQAYSRRLGLRSSRVLRQAGRLAWLSARHHLQRAFSTNLVVLLSAPEATEGVYASPGCLSLLRLRDKDHWERWPTLLIYTRRFGDRITGGFCPEDGTAIPVIHRWSMVLQEGPWPTLDTAKEKGLYVTWDHPPDGQGRIFHFACLAVHREQAETMRDQWLINYRSYQKDRVGFFPLAGSPLLAILSAGGHLTDVVPDTKGFLVKSVCQGALPPKGASWADAQGTYFCFPTVRALEEYSTEELVLTRRPRSTWTREVKVHVGFRLRLRYALSKSEGRARVRGEVLHDLPPGTDEYELAQELEILPEDIVVMRTPVPANARRLLHHIASILGQYLYSHTMSQDGKGFMEEWFDMSVVGFNILLDHPGRLCSPLHLGQPVRCWIHIGLQTEEAAPPLILQEQVWSVPIPSAERRRSAVHIRRSVEHFQATAPDIPPIEVWHPLTSTELAASLDAPLCINGLRALVPNHDVAEQWKRRLELAETQDPSPSSSSSTATTDTDTPCPICLEVHVVRQELSSCGCRFCLPCLARSVEALLLDDECPSILCPQPSCRTPLSITDILGVADRQALFAYIHHQARRTSLRRPDLLRSCPKGCAVFSLSSGRVFACPECNVVYCLVCSDRRREPILEHAGFCARQDPSWDQYLEEARRAGAASCPLCETPIVRNGGCYHMVCTAPRCHAHFCWGCLAVFGNRMHDPEAVGVVVETTPTTTTIQVLPETWALTDHVPAPAKPLVLWTRSMNPIRFDRDLALSVGSRVPVYTYIYDHMETCAHPVHPMPHEGHETA